MTQQEPWQQYLEVLAEEAPEPEMSQEDQSKNLDALKAALEQQRKYENGPFTGDEERPPVMGESITYHLAGLYCWPPAYVLSLPEAERDERLQEIWKSFALAGDIISRYEKATVALLKQEEARAERDELARQHQHEENERVLGLPGSPSDEWEGEE